MAASTTTITNNLKIYLIENLYDEFEIIVRDKPPVAPLVKLHTYIGVDNRLLILFNKSVATNKEKEIVIREEDRERFIEIRRAQGLDENELIEFSGDDIIKKYQILRTRTPPKNYGDFKDAYLVEEDTLLDEIGSQERANAASYTDKIKPNTRYYYTFRCIDIHDQISNPTEVYQVEIINEGGTIYPLIRPYEFPQEEEGRKTKDLKRFLMIRPSVLQSFMSIKTENMQNYEQLGNDGIQLGIKENSVQNKTYKMRLVSKNSNKVYDINFSFGKTIKIVE